MGRTVSCLVLPGAEGIVPTEKSSSGVQGTVAKAQGTLRMQLREGRLLRGPLFYLTSSTVVPPEVLGLSSTTGELFHMYVKEAHTY